ncbi:unnamed protein product [Pieris macdunnoughi]|uniref:C2H2-type domain-containing protein n=1 Tax=Pieris macdunnoughi TaxID=345717 RepID=A0A821W2H4_9NEOP|nr:unnamed protein product [Pieris macdunnoughi]
MSEQSIPQLFVEGQFLPNKWLHTKIETEYNINGKVFTIQNDDNDVYYKFEVVSDTDSLGESSSGLLDKDECKFLPVSIKKTLYGIIVNDEIIVPINNWHTIITLEDHIWCCVCLDIDADAITHIKSGIHIKSMNKYQPLDRFDLNLVRLIDQYYHCAVCNESFHKSEENHFDSETHENKILYAINHCSDVQDMRNIDKLTYPFDPLFAHLFDSSQPQSSESSIPHSVEPSHYHSIERSPNESPSVSSSSSRADYVESVSITSESGIDFNENDGFYDINWENKPVERSYASVAAAVPKLFFINWFGKKCKIEKDSWNMILKIKSHIIYCMACKIIDDVQQKRNHCLEKTHIKNLKLCTPVEKYKNYVIRKVDEKYHHCANCNNLQAEDRVAEHIEEAHKQKPKTLKKPRKPRSEIENKNGSKINSNSLQNNGNKRKVTEGKVQEITVTKSKGPEKKDTQNQAIDEIKIKVQEINEIEIQGQAINEIEIKGQSINDVEVKRQAINEIEIQGQAINEIEIQGQKANVINYQEKNNDITNSEIIIQQFGCRIKILLLSYHLVFITLNNDAYCNLCNKTMSKLYISQHLKDEIHIFLLQRLFIPSMGVNLIRTVNAIVGNGHLRLNAGLHCALCHFVMNNNSMDLIRHITTSLHIFNLNKALRNGQTQDDNTEEKKEQRPIEKGNDEENKVKDTPRDVVNLNKTLSNCQRTQNDNTEEKKEQRPIEKENDEGNKREDTLTGVNYLNTALCKGQRIQDDDTEEKKDQRPIEKDNDEENIKGEGNERGDTPTGVANLNKALCKGQRTQDDNKKENKYQKPIEKENDEENIKDTPIDAQPDKDNLINNEKVSEANIKHTEKVIRKSKVISILKENKTERDPVIEIYTELVNHLKDQGLWNDIGDLRVNEIFFEIIMAKLKNKNLKISFASYNTFVSVGNGTWYCVVCSVDFLKMGVHFTIDGHLKNLRKHTFIDKYDVNLIRRNRQYYHCGICNVITTKEELQTHITWNEHSNNLSDSMKNRHRNLKGLKTIELSLGKEKQFDDILLHTKIVANYKFEAVNTTSVAKKNKIITHAGKSFKLTWDAWQGVTKNKNGYKCIFCRVDMKNYDLSGHVNSERHTIFLKSFEKKYLPALIRKINDSTVNCLTCASEVSSKEHILLDHIKGKKHLRNHKYILNASDKSCYDDVLNL